MFWRWIDRCGKKWLNSLLFALFCLPLSGIAQKPLLQFLEDSVSFGQPIRAVFYYRHSPEEEVLFPDSGYNYAPFEFVGKEYFPTRTTAEESVDSVLYTLRTFEDTASFYLSLPVFLFKGKDTVKVFSERGSVVFQPFLAEPLDSLQLISNTIPLSLDQRINYALYVLSIVALLLASGLVYLLFGKRLARQWARYRMKSAQKRFITEFDSLTSVQPIPTEKMEKALALWKMYIESLKAKPYTTFTSSEIATQLKREQLKKNLQSIDAAVYGGRSRATAKEDFTVLRRVALEEFVETFREKKS